MGSPLCGLVSAVRLRIHAAYRIVTREGVRGQQVLQHAQRHVSNRVTDTVDWVVLIPLWEKALGEARVPTATRMASVPPWCARRRSFSFAP